MSRHPNTPRKLRPLSILATLGCLACGTCEPCPPEPIDAPVIQALGAQPVDPCEGDPVTVRWVVSDLHPSGQLELTSTTPPIFSEPQPIGVSGTSGGHAGVAPDPTDTTPEYTLEAFNPWFEGEAANKGNRDVSTASLNVTPDGQQEPFHLLWVDCRPVGDGMGTSIATYFRDEPWERYAGSSKRLDWFSNPYDDRGIDIVHEITSHLPDGTDATIEFTLPPFTPTQDQHGVTGRPMWGAWTVEVIVGGNSPLACPPPEAAPEPREVWKAFDVELDDPDMHGYYDARHWVFFPPAPIEDPLPDGKEEWLDLSFDLAPYIQCGGG